MNSTHELVPKHAGYNFPAEWEEHDAVYFAWPYDRTSFPEIKETETAFIKLLHAFEGNEQVKLLVHPDIEKRVIARLQKNSLQQVEPISFDYGDVWFRDYGPTFITGPDLGIIKWTYNAYGNKYPELLKDDKVADFLQQQEGWTYFKPNIVMEGGSIETNGLGTILTTKQCLLNKNRNPGLKKRDIEQIFRSYISAKNIIWLEDGLLNDDTDGHIDNLARFVNANTILVASESKKTEPNYGALAKNEAVLKQSVDQDGKSFNIIKLPIPHVFSGELSGSASYANFYIANHSIMLPTFGVKEDAYAIGIMKEHFPKRTIIPIPSTYFVVGGGTIHCMSQQLPKYTI